MHLFDRLLASSVHDSRKRKKIISSICFVFNLNSKVQVFVFFPDLKKIGKYGFGYDYEALKRHIRVGKMGQRCYRKFRASMQLQKVPDTNLFTAVNILQNKGPPSLPTTPPVTS